MPMARLNHICRNAAPLALFAGLVAAADQAAAAPTLTITPDRALRFGTMVVIDNASRRVSSSGEITDATSTPGRTGDAGPGGYTIAYDRGDGSLRPLTITLQITFAPVQTLGQSGMAGGVTAFETDLPGAGEILPGHPVTATIRNCTSRVCSLSFSFGARLDVSRAGLGGTANLAAPVSATVLDVQG